MMRRRDDWQSRLSAAAAAGRAAEFRWGAHDCVTFAADCVLAMTGFDPLSDYRGDYDSEIGAGRILLERGHETLADAITEQLGAPLENVRMMGRGDVALVEHDGTRAAGVCLGHVVAVPAKTRGLAFLPRDHATAGWRI